MMLIKKEKEAGSLQSVAQKTKPKGHMGTGELCQKTLHTELIQVYANMYYVKELLGHESLDALKHYTRLTITDLKGC